MVDGVVGCVWSGGGEGDGVYWLLRAVGWGLIVDLSNIGRAVAELREIRWWWRWGGGGWVGVGWVGR